MKYQRKLKREIAELYQSNDPLRWVYMANKFGVDRRMTPREFRIFKRRMFATFKRMGVAVADAMKNLVGAMTNAAQSFANMVTGMKQLKGHGLNDITVHRIPQTQLGMGEIRIAPSLAELNDATPIPIGEMHISVEKHVDKDINGGKL